MRRKTLILLLAYIVAEEHMRIITLITIIFNTNVTVNKSGDSYSLELDDNTPSPTILLPEKINVKIYETKNDVLYFNII